MTLALELWLKAQPREYVSPRRGCYRNAIAAERWAKWVEEAGLEWAPDPFRHSNRRPHGQVEEEQAETSALLTSRAQS